MRFDLSARVFGSVGMGTGDFAEDAEGTGGLKLAWVQTVAVYKA